MLGSNEWLVVRDGRATLAWLCNECWLIMCADTSDVCIIRAELDGNLGASQIVAYHYHTKHDHPHSHQSHGPDEVEFALHTCFLAD